MNALYEKALSHTLASTRTGKKEVVVFKNRLPIQINILEYKDGPESKYIPFKTLDAGQEFEQKDLDTGTVFVALAAGSGGLCCEIRLDDTTIAIDDKIHANVEPEDLKAPNCIGGYPEPDLSGSGDAAIIPRDSNRVVVGVGKIEATKAVLLREQFWRRGGDSYVLAPGEERTISVTHTSGREETSSDNKTVSMAVSASGSASWGAVSASISASLSASSTNMHQLTVREEETRYESCVLKNDKGKPPCMYLHWQLVDIVTIFFKGKVDGKGDEVDQIASIEQTLRPTIVAGPYYLPFLAKSPADRG